MKAAASARLNLSAIRCASHPSTSNALSSSSRCDAFGSAESSCSGIEIRSTCGVPVSATAPLSVAQPEPMSVWSTSTSNAPASTVTTLAMVRIEADEPQHADDLARRHRIDQIPAVRRHRRRQRLLLDGQPAQPVVVARAQIGGEGLLVRGLGLGGARQGRAVHRDGLAVEHGQTGFLFLELRFDVGLKGVELAQEPQHGRLDFHVGAHPRRGSPRPGFAFDFRHR